MDNSNFVDCKIAERETLATVMRCFQREVTKKRKSKKSVESENYRIDRFLREEQWLAGISMSNLRAEHIEQYRDLGLSALPSRGKIGGRGAQGNKPKKPLSPGTVKKEMNLLSSAIKHSKRRLSLKKMWQMLQTQNDQL